MKVSLAVLVTIAAMGAAVPRAPAALAAQPPDPCIASALALSTSMQGAAGSREGFAIVRNTSSKACRLNGRPAVTIADKTLGNLHVHIVAGPTNVLDPKGAGSDRRLGILRPGRRAFSALRWGNYCGKAKGSFTLVATLPNGRGKLSAPLLSVGSSKPLPVSAPPCNGPGQPSDLDVGPFVIVSQSLQP